MTDTPDYAKILRATRPFPDREMQRLPPTCSPNKLASARTASSAQGDLEDVLCDILAATFDSNNAVTHEGEDGRDYSLVVDKTTDGQVRATLYRHDGGIHWRDVEVAQVRLDYTVKQVQP